MSWFDTSNIVSLAKSTLKEAQKTIDKALDITDDDVETEPREPSESPATNVVSEPSTPFASSSIWGSFTGSFFEASSPDSSTGISVDTLPSITKQPNTSSALQESFSLIKQRSLTSSNTKSKHQLLNRNFEQTAKSKPDRENGRTEKKKPENEENKTESQLQSEEKKDEVHGDNVKDCAFPTGQGSTTQENHIVKGKTKFKIDKDTEGNSTVESNKWGQTLNANLEHISNPDGTFISDSNTEETKSKALKANETHSTEVEQKLDDSKENANIDSKSKSPVSENRQNIDGKRGVLEEKSPIVCDTYLGSKTSSTDENARGIQCNIENTASSFDKATDDQVCKELDSINDSCQILKLTVNPGEKDLSKDKKNSETKINVKTDSELQPVNFNLLHADSKLTSVSNHPIPTVNDQITNNKDKHSDRGEAQTKINDEKSLCREDLNEDLVEVQPSSNTEPVTKINSCSPNQISPCQEPSQNSNSSTSQNSPREISTPVKATAEPTSFSPPNEIILRRKAPSESEAREKRRSDRFSTGSSGGNNRLSTISADSVRLSSEGSTTTTTNSVEIIVSPDSGGEGTRSLSNSSMTSPSVEIISESSGKVVSRSSDSVEVLKSDEDSKEDEMEGEGEEDGDDSYQSMSESTQTLTTAMNIMLKSSSSLETSFSDMASSRENISLSRALHLPLSQFSSQSETQHSAQVEMQCKTQPTAHSLGQPNTQSLGQPNSQSLSQPNTQSLGQPNSLSSSQPNSQSLIQVDTQQSTQPVSRSEAMSTVLPITPPVKKTESQSTIRSKTVSFIDVDYEEQSTANESLSSQSIPEATQENAHTGVICLPEAVALTQTDVQELEINEGASTESLTPSSLEKGSAMESTQANSLSLTQPLSQVEPQESVSVMDGSASTLVASSDDGTFVHIPGDSSPVSLDRCELIKIGSGHTSGDDMDTNTTSSSIEIISSPYGDNSSYTTTTASRASPSKLPSCSPRTSTTRRGDNELLGRGSAQTHRRAPSETSSEDTEADKLQKKISEMTEVLEARELKLLTLSQQHSDLNETHSKLKMEKDSMARMNTEFTQRLASLEKQYQQVMTEKENLRRQVEATKQAASSQRCEEDKDEIIAQLRTEGAALSRQQMLLTTSVRKLRAAEKESNRSRDSLRAELDSRTADLERLQKLVQAKEEVERSQIEAVNQLSKTNARLERDVTSLQQQLDNLTSTLIESQKELQSRTAALAEMELRLESNTSSVEARLRQELEVELSVEVERREQVERSLEHLRQSLMASEQEHTQRVEALRRENLAALRRLEEAQLRHESLAESMISAASPLAREIETLSASHARESEAWEREERRLNETINELQSRLSSLKHSERTAKESAISMAAKISALESKLESEHRDVLRLREQLHNLHEDIEKISKEKESALQAKESQVASLSRELAESRRCCSALESRLSVERAALESEKRRSVSLQDQMQGYQQVSSAHSSGQAVTDARDSATPPGFHSQRSSPLSLGRPVSVTDSVFPPSEDGDNSHAHSSLNKSVYDSLRLGGSTSLIESLQSQVKLKDTEVTHLQWELSRRELERSSLTAQVTDLTSRLEECEARMRDSSEVRGQYDALLQMYGEKLEECQELRLDLDDVKEMYKAQIDQLLKKDESG